MSGIKRKPVGKPFHVFHRTWWRANSAWPDGREPHAGKRSTIGYAATETEARSMCVVWCANHAPGKLSDKAEYESC